MKSIIKNGIYNIVTCNVCKCEYSFTSTDLEQDGTIVCPQCGATNTAPKKPA